MRCKLLANFGLAAICSREKWSDVQIYTTLYWAKSKIIKALESERWKMLFV
jgi:hypothetical protein